MNFLEKQFRSAKDPRVRAQTALLLGQTGAEAAVAPLCAAVRDEEALVRSAAASALGELRLPEAARCLAAVSGDPDAAVRAAIDRGRAQPTLPPEGLYLYVEPVLDRGAALPSVLTSLADRLLRERLTELGASFAPAGEDKKAAQAWVKRRNLNAFQLRLQLLPSGSGGGLKVEMLVMTYPGQSLKGSWNVKATGGKPESLVRAMVPRVVADAAADLEWKN